MEDYIVLAQFDNPSSAEYLRLKEELKENKIQFHVQGEDGSFNDSLFYEIKVFIKKCDFEEAKSLLLQIKENQALPSFCPKCDSEKILMKSKNTAKCSDCGHEWLPYQE